MKKANFLIKLKLRWRVLIFFLLWFSTSYSQVKIGDNPNTIDAASLLELEGTSRTLVLTRVTDVQMQAITPLQGAIVYNIDQQCIFYFDQTNWKNLCAEGGSGGDGATLVDNEDNTYTFTDANGVETIISFSEGGFLTGDSGSLFFAGTDGNASENNTELFWDNTNNRLGIGTNSNLNYKLNVNGNIGSTHLLLNNGNPFGPAPLIIRGGGQDQRMIAFQDENRGTTVFNINFKGGGLNIDDLNQSHRLFIKVLGGIGIDTREPSETLDVAGTFRVRQLNPSQTTDNFVTVDANGVFHRSATNSSSGKKPINFFENFSGQWANNALKFGLKFGTNVAPIFTSENFKDGGNSIYEVKGNSLVVKLSGKYDIRSNLSLIGANTSAAGQTATTSARIYINASPIGAISVAANNGSTDKSVLSSIHIDELLKLKANDVITIIMSTDAFSDTIYMNSEGTSNFSITKLN